MQISKKLITRLSCYVNPTDKKNIILYQSIPGLGWLSSAFIMTHIEDIKRFRNTDHLSSYIGLIPNNHSSGEKECIGRITFRGVAALKTISDFHQFNLADWGINF